MTVLLVLFTFAAFLLVDHFYSRKRVTVRPAMEAAQGTREFVPRLQPNLVGGFHVPDNLRYHPGHTWALAESPTLVRVGLDDFASRLIGHITSVNLPQRGQWIRQGQKLCTIHRNGVTVDMVSPIEGSVTNVNDSLRQDPELARRDPYNEGWFVTVQSPDAKINFRNLLGGALARWWTEESSSRLQRRMPAALGILAQDGGVAMDNVTAQLSDEQWAQVAREFFLS